MRIKAFVMVVLGAVISSIADPTAGQPGEYTVNVQSVGCDLKGTDCFAYLDKIVGINGCMQNNVRWDLSKDANGKAALAILLEARALGQSVTIYTGSCWSVNAIYPTFYYLRL